MFHLDKGKTLHLLSVDLDTRMFDVRSFEAKNRSFEFNHI